MDNNGFSATRAAAHVAVAAVLIIIALLLEGAEAMACGWLLCFAFIAGIPVGSLVLLMIHRLTGGAWGFALAPFLRPAALCIPVLAIAFVPLAVATHALYPWTSAATAAHLYLNVPTFIARAAIAVIGWSVLGVIFGGKGGAPLVAALGLAFYGLTISLVSIDWFLSMDPHYASTAFGATIAIQQILTALAAAALFAPGELRERDLGDLSGLLIAALLGVVYLALMTLIVQWYGNLPDRAHWYLLRSQNGWAFVIGAGAILALAGFAMLLLLRIRQSRIGVRLAGAVILTAIIVHLCWLIVPAYSSQARVIVAALLCFIAMVLVCLPLAAGTRGALQQASQHAR
ncbi:MAG: hypothetical protein JOZ84_00540 [Methylobacteriaceae bacterium]|nr:hypothetical protein [Methylobacteriaceae bacterium]